MTLCRLMFSIGGVNTAWNETPNRQSCISYTKESRYVKAFPCTPQAMNDTPLLDRRHMSTSPNFQKSVQLRSDACRAGQEFDKRLELPIPPQPVRNGVGVLGGA